MGAEPWSVSYGNGYVNRANLYNNGVRPAVRGTWGGRRTWGKRSADAEPEADAWSVGYAGRANYYNTPANLYINRANLYNNNRANLYNINRANRYSNRNNLYYPY